MLGLRDDLARLEDDWFPDEDDPVRAPLLKDWAIAFRDSELLWRLMGDPHETARDLPGVAVGETLCMMQVLAADDGFTWARDLRGFYRLSGPRAA